MSANESIDMIKIINAMRQLRHNISVGEDFSTQMEQLKLLKRNDKTGIVCTVIDFMTHCATVPIMINTQDEKLDKLFADWQKNINANLGVDIPRGLRELSTEYYRERWWSSFPALVVQWGEVGKGKERYTVPTRMYFVNGSAIHIDAEKDNLLGRKYFLGKDKSFALTNTDNRSVIIRKPYNCWYENYPTPYLVKHGVLFNALLKEAIINKQADVINQIIPYLLLMKAGTDKLAELGMLADKADMKALKEQIIKAKSEADQTGELGKLLATLNYDVNLEHFIPDLGKILDEKILRSTDKNILAGLGMIELEGFAKTREESIMNPKLLIEEVNDGVADWRAILTEIFAQIVDRNKDKHPELAEKEIIITSGRIQTFMTDAMRDMLRSCADRGIISYKTEVEDLAQVNYTVEKAQIQQEEKEGLRKTFQPKPSQPVVPSSSSKPTDNIPNDKKPGTPESKNFKNAEQEMIQAPYENIDALPNSVSDALPVGAQLIFLKAFNSAIKEGKTEEEAFKIAWSAVGNTYKKVPGKDKWVKKD